MDASQHTGASVHSTYRLQMQFSGMNHQWYWCPDDASRNFNPVNIVLKHVVTLLF